MFHYSKTAKNLIFSFKKERNFIAYNCIMSLLKERIEKDNELKKLVKESDYLVFIPGNRKNTREKGFDSGKMIAKFLKKTYDKEMLDLLNNSSKSEQKKLNMSERKASVKQNINLKNCKKLELIRGKRILIVDDIITTGSSIERAYSIIKEANPKEINFLVALRRV